MIRIDHDHLYVPLWTEGKVGTDGPNKGEAYRNRVGPPKMVMTNGEICLTGQTLGRVM